MKRLSSRILAGVRTGLGTVLCLAGLFSAAPAEPAKAASGTRPNVALIVLDAARAEHFSFMGYERNTRSEREKQLRALGYLQ